MEILINALETAEEFAHAAVRHEFLDLGEHEEYENEGCLYEGDDYKSEVQDAYNRHYDFYFEVLTNNEKVHDHKRAYQSEKTLMEVSSGALSLIDAIATKYTGLGADTIYEINNKFYIFKLKQDG